MPEDEPVDVCGGSCWVQPVGWGVGGQEEKVEEGVGDVWERLHIYI